MASIELKRKQLELARVTVARQELEFKIEERLDEIERIKEHIKVSMQREETLKNELKEMKE